MPEPEYWADRQFNQPRQPVVGVSWDDVQRYAEWAELRLPTEAEWEHAYRAGTRTRFYTVDKDKDLERAGWFDDNSGDKLHPIGEKEPNSFGLYDMHGNVWEWVEDDWHDNYKEAPHDGRAWVNDPRGVYRLLRSGCWSFNARNCRSADRNDVTPVYRYFNVGFRLVRSGFKSGPWEFVISRERKP